jgi:hypothetical protein
VPGREEVTRRDVLAHPIESSEAGA